MQTGSSWILVADSPKSYVIYQSAKKVDCNQLYGFDLEQEIIDPCFELFRGRECFNADVFAADLMGPTDQEPRLQSLYGQMDLVQVPQLSPLLDWDKMFEAAKPLMSLGRATPGTMPDGVQECRLISNTPPEFWSRNL